MRIKLIIVLIILCSDFNAQVNDVEGRTYKTVQIASQTWMAENLNVSKFRNGDLIFEAKNELEWQEAAKNKQPAWCYYKNDTANGSKYGKLYNWYAVGDPRGLAPQGWIIPEDSQWLVMIEYLGGANGAGQKLKSLEISKIETSYYYVGGYYEQKWVTCSNCNYWTDKQKANNPCTVCRNTGGKSINTGKYIPKTQKKNETKVVLGGWNGTNESGFSALPGGYVSHRGDFFHQGYRAPYWSSSIDADSKPIYYSMISENSVVISHINGNYDATNGWFYGSGYYVRCIKDSVDYEPSKDLGSDVDKIDENTRFDVVQRKRLNDPDIPKYELKKDVEIHLKLTVSPEGKITNAEYMNAKSTTKDKTLIEDVIYQIVRQVRYEKGENEFTAYLLIKLYAR